MTKGVVATLYGIDENWPVDLVLGLVVGFLMIAIMNATGLTVGYIQAIYPLTAFAAQISVISTIIVIGFLAPVGEESLFRGIFMWFGWTNLKYFTLAVIVSSLAFAFFHFQAYGAYLPAAYVGAFVVGVLLAMLTQQTKSLLPAIIVHSLININLYIQAEQLLVVGV